MERRRSIFDTKELSGALSKHCLLLFVGEGAGLLVQQLHAPLGLIDLHHAELALPAMEGLLAYLLFPAHVQDRLVGSLRLPQDADLLLGSIPFAFHCMGPF